MMVIYAYEHNIILVEPLQDRTKDFILTAYQNIMGHLSKRGSKPRQQRLEN